MKKRCAEFKRKKETEMARINLEANDSPKIYIESVGGSLQVKGWDEENIRIEVQHEDELTYTFEDNELKLTSQGDCILRVPDESELRVESVGGDAYIVDVEGELNIEDVSGSLALKNVGATTIGEVSGNLSVRGVEGGLTIEQVSGNASLRDIEGDVQAKEVHANLSLRDIEGDAVAHSDGNADIRLEPESGTDIQVEAQGNLFCNVEEGADADVHLHSDAEHMQIYTENGKQLLHVEKHEFTLGDGGADLRLSAAGTIDFRSRDQAADLDFDLDLDFVEDMAGLADEISQHVSAQVEGQLESLNEQLETLQERLRNSGDRAARHAQRRVAAAQRQLERKLGRHGARGVVNARAKPGEPVSSHEP